MSSQCLGAWVLLNTVLTDFELLQQIVQQHPEIKVKYLSEYCFSGTYIVTLLTEGYNFTSETYSNINFIKKVSRSVPMFSLSHTIKRSMYELFNLRLLLKGENVRVFGFWQNIS